MTSVPLPEAALQLYTVRAALGEDRSTALRRIREWGFSAVEVAGAGGTSTTLRASELGEFGLRVVGAYFLGELASLPAFLDEQRGLENTVVISMRGPDSFVDADGARRAADNFNASSEIVTSAGMMLGYHNHGWEFARTVGGELLFDLFESSLDPAVFLEFDFYWAGVAGLSPDDARARYGHRIRRLHLKDGPMTDSPVMQVMGEGAFDVVDATDRTPGLEMVVIAFDDFDGDPLEAAGRDLHYLRESGVAR